MNGLNYLSDAGHKNRVLRHVLFWLVFYILDVTRYVLIKSDPISYALVFNFFALIVQIGFSYFLAYFVIPRLFVSKSRWLAIIYLILGIYVFAVINRIFIVHVAEELMLPKPFIQESIQEIVSDVPFLLKRYIPSNLWVALIFISVKYFFDFEKLKSKDLQLQKEKSNTELKALKAQLNPHFLFNTLNNIYSLSLENSTKTPESIAKLSEMLDHILYRTEGDLVTLSGELKLIKNFIELEQLRYDERLKVSIQEEIHHKMEIPPLILLSLVENAFKHGAAEDSGSPEIDIRIKCVKDHFEFFISNSMVKKEKAHDAAAIGLSNIKRQLDLLYKNQHELNISSISDQFTVDLKIFKA